MVFRTSSSVTSGHTILFLPLGVTAPVGTVGEGGTRVSLNIVSFFLNIVADLASVSPCRVGVLSHGLGLVYWSALNTSFPQAPARKLFQCSFFTSLIPLKNLFLSFW